MYFALCLRKFFHLDPTPSTLNVSPSNDKTDQTDIYDKEHKTCDPKLCEVALTLELQLIAPIQPMCLSSKPQENTTQTFVLESYPNER